MRYRLADWHTTADRKKLESIRYQVFVQEQHVPVALEWDQYDDDAIHFLGERQNHAIACARLRIDHRQCAQIGRMAVLAGYRRQGIGSGLLQTVLDYCEQHGLTGLSLHAQIQVVDFYRRFGFEPQGEIFLDAGIQHRAMFRNCAKKGA